MRALVTGGAGFIGGHIVDKLISKGYDVTVLDCLEEPTHKNMQPNYLNDKVRFVKGNVLDSNKLLEAIEGVDVIFHEAATGGFTSNISKYYEWNSLATAKLWEVIVNKKINLKKFIVASSVAVYGEGKYSCKNCGIVYPNTRSVEQLNNHCWEVLCPICKDKVSSLPTDETKPVQPLLHYSQSKYDQERITLIMGKSSGIPVVALRYFLTYGQRQSFTNPYTGICSIFSKQIMNNAAPTIFEDGLQTRDFINVEDIADANMLVLENEKANNQVFNVGTGVPTTIQDVAKTLSSLLAKKSELEISSKFRIGDVRHIYADISSLNSLGFAPKVSLKQGLKKYVDWLSSSKQIF